MRPLQMPADELGFLQMLNQEGVRYLLIGGYATKHYGCSTQANDVDLLIDNRRENAERLYPVIESVLGYKPRFNVADLSCRGKQLKMPNNDIDILTSTDAVESQTILLFI